MTKITKAIREASTQPAHIRAACVDIYREAAREENRIHGARRDPLEILFRAVIAAYILGRMQSEAAEK